MRSVLALTSVASLSIVLLVGCKPQLVEPISEETPPVETEVEATAVSFANAKCPIMGGDPDPELTAEYDGQTIGFCCDGCPQKWETLSDEEKAEKFAKVSAAAHEEHGEHEGHEHEEHEHEEHDEQSTEETGEANPS